MRRSPSSRSHRGPWLSACASLVSALVLGSCGRFGRPAAAPEVVDLPAPAQAPAAHVVPVSITPKPKPQPTPKAAALPPPPPIPILMYHVVDNVPANAPYPGLYVAPDLFAAQIAGLAAAGYHAITLQQAYDIWTGHAAAPPHPIVLSFDDGYVGVYNNAVPLLQARGWPGVLNLQVGRIGIPGGLTADQVRAMIAQGWEVDDHTITHPDLTKVTPARRQTEIVGAARQLRQEFGVPVRFFCYPAGRYDPAVVDAVQAAGFLGATTTWPGDAYPPTEGYFTLDRVRVSSGESAAGLLRVLAALGTTTPGPAPKTFPPPRVAVSSAAPSSATATTASAAPAGASGGRTL